MLAAVLALMTAAAIAAIAFPLIRSRAPSAPRREHDLAVYRDQLAEIDRDRDRGVIDTEQARAARVEIERRLLAAARNEDAPSLASPKWRRGTMIAAFVLPLAALGAYLATGRPDLPAQPFADRIESRGTPTEMARLVDELARRLQQKPDDLQGWALLGRSEVTLGRYKQAVDAFGRAIALAPDRGDLLSAYGEALTLAANGQVTPAAKQALDAALAREPDDPRSNFYRGLADVQAGDPRAALTRWLNLEARATQDAPWLPMLRQQIDDVAKQSGIDPKSIMPNRKSPPTAAAPSGPNAADMERMSKLSPQERQQAIRSMVEGLEQRLQQQPDDIAGWQRLGRAWLVLGEYDKAVHALGEADKRKPDDPEILGGLAEAMLRRAPAGAPAPDDAIAVLRRLLKAQPDNALALFYVSEAEARAGNTAAARDMLTRLLKEIPADAPQRATVERRLNELR